MFRLLVHNLVLLNVYFLFNISSGFHIPVLSLSSLESLNLPDKDPVGFAINSDGYAVVATIQEVILAHNLQKVFSFVPNFQPSTVALNSSNNDVVIGGKVRRCIGVKFHNNWLPKTQNSGYT